MNTGVSHFSSSTEVSSARMPVRCKIAVRGRYAIPAKQSVRHPDLAVQITPDYLED